MCLALYFLYDCLGPSIFAGVAIMVLFYQLMGQIIMVPVNGWIASRSRTLNQEQMDNKDKRAKLMVSANTFMSRTKFLVALK